MSEELTPKACPHCGAARIWTHSIEPGEILFDCGTYSPNFDDQPMIRADKKCYERELNAVRGELEEVKGMATIAIKRCGALTTERDELRATNTGLLDALWGVISSASPHPVANPAMWEAWEKARAAIAGAQPAPFDPEWNCPTHFAAGDPSCPACISKQPAPQANE